MRYISIFSGIEAASVAWEPIGWTPIAFSEIDPFCCAVLDYRFPGVPNLGDITKIDWRKYRGKCDIVIGGSPCQSFSIAGKREGLAGESGLMFEFIRCVRDVRPRWFLWENVPGAFSVEHGAAFGQLVSEMDELRYGLAWRVLDAQFFGVAQRRRRVFLVGSLGSMRAADVLFEPDCMRGDNQSSKEKRKAVAADSTDRAGADRCAGFELSVYALQSDGTTSLNSNGGGIAMMVAHTPSTPSTTNASRSPRTSAARSDWRGFDGSVACALASRPNFSKGQGASLICVGDDNARATIDENLCGSIKVGGSPPYVSDGYIVRRLMPIECERLQGFPDGWTDVPYKGRDHAPDTPRYRALGNAFCVPVVRWIGERIELADKAAVDGS